MALRHAPPPRPDRDLRLHDPPSLNGAPGAAANAHTSPALAPAPTAATTAAAAANGTPSVLPPAMVQKLNSANEQTWLLIGRVAEQIGDLEHALSAYEHALRHNSNSLSGLTQVAGIARIQENYPKAIDYFQRVLKLQQDNGEIWSALGHCYLMQDDLQMAYSAYQEALYRLPNPKEDPKLWYGIGILYDRYGSLDHAEEAFSSVLRMDKDFDKANEILFRLGIIYKQQLKFDDALRCFDQILRNPPSPLATADIWFQIGHVYEQRKDHVRAKNAYERVVDVNPTHAKVLQQLGWLYHQDGTAFQNQELAVHYLTKSLEADPTAAQSWYLLGRAFMAGQKYNKAYEAYQQAVYRDSRNPTFWCSIGVLYFQINQFRDALDAYSRAIRINPYISEVWFDLGSLYESCNNQIADAIDAYARAHELDPGNDAIAKRLQLLSDAQASGSQVVAGPPPPGPQDVHPTAYASASAQGPPIAPLHALASAGGPLQLLPQPSPSSRPAQHAPSARPDSRSGPAAAAAVPGPAAAVSGPGGQAPFRGGPPPPVVVDADARPPLHNFAPMEIERPRGFSNAERPPRELLVSAANDRERGIPGERDRLPQVPRGDADRLLQRGEPDRPAPRRGSINELTGPGRLLSGDLNDRQRDLNDRARELNLNERPPRDIGDRFADRVALPPPPSQQQREFNGNGVERGFSGNGALPPPRDFVDRVGPAIGSREFAGLPPPLQQQQQRGGSSSVAPMVVDESEPQSFASQSPFASQQSNIRRGSPAMRPNRRLSSPQPQSHRHASPHQQHHASPHQAHRMSPHQHYASRHASPSRSPPVSLPIDFPSTRARSRLARGPESPPPQQQRRASPHPPWLNDYANAPGQQQQPPRFSRSPISEERERERVRASPSMSRVIPSGPGVGPGSAGVSSMGLGGPGAQRYSSPPSPPLDAGPSPRARYWDPRESKSQQQQPPQQPASKQARSSSSSRGSGRYDPRYDVDMDVEQRRPEQSPRLGNGSGISGADGSSASGSSSGRRPHRSSTRDSEKRGSTSGGSSGSGSSKRGPGSSAQHVGSYRGASPGRSSSGSAPARSPTAITAATPHPPSRIVDDDYDEPGVADALMGLAGRKPIDPPRPQVRSPPLARRPSSPPRYTATHTSPRSVASHRNSVSSQSVSSHRSNASPPPPPSTSSIMTAMNTTTASIAGTGLGSKRPHSPTPSEEVEVKRRRPSSRPSPIPFRQQPTGTHSTPPPAHMSRSSPTALPAVLPPQPRPKGPSPARSVALPPIATLSPKTSGPRSAGASGKRSGNGVAAQKAGGAGDHDEIMYDAHARSPSGSPSRSPRTKVPSPTAMAVDKD